MPTSPRAWLQGRIFGPNPAPFGRAILLGIQALILLSLVSFSIETLPDLSEPAREFLRAFEVFTVAVFTIEYLARLFAAERRLGFVFSFFGIIDLLAILPFYLATGVDLRAVRIFRVIRLVRILKLVRYNAALHRFVIAFKVAREELLIFFTIAGAVLFTASVGIYYFENQAQPEVFKSVFHSLWWAVVTLTTVGYGDMYPITAGGRVFTGLVLLTALGIIAVPTSIMTSALSEARRRGNDPGS